MSTTNDPPEQFSSPPEDPSDRVFSSGSEGSLSWDSGGHGLSFNNSDIVDPFLVADLHQPGISVLGDINQRYRIRTSERTSNSTVNSASSQDTVKMPTELDKKKHRALITSAELFVDDDVTLITDFNLVTLDYLKECSSKALAVKTEIQTAASISQYAR